MLLKCDEKFKKLILCLQSVNFNMLRAIFTYLHEDIFSSDVKC
jgi:hypothetical protein